MAKKNIPDTQKYFQDVVTKLREALARLEGEDEDSSPFLGVDTPVSLARQWAISVNYYAKAMINDEQFQDLERLEKLANQYQAARFARLVPADSSDTIGRLFAQVASSAAIDEQLTRKQLAEGIRHWLTTAKA